MPNVPLPRDVAVGRGIVIVDTPDGSSSVTKITGRGYGTDAEGNAVAVDTERDLCPTTPCAVDLRKGAQTIVMRSGDGRDYGAALVTVGDQPVVVRHLYEQTHRGGAYLPGLILGGIGLSFALSGLITYAAARPAESDLPANGQTASNIGIGIALGGAALVVTGGLLAIITRGTHRAGATTIFSTSPAAPSLPSSPASETPL